MSFFTGLVTGAATAVSGNLQAALDRRENEMSKARAYMRTRAAQKAELADAHDKRASKALNRFINEFDGNVAKGLAAYKAVGGDVDAAEAYLVELDGTRAVGLDYNINDKFKFDNIDLEQFADLSRSDAASSIGMSTTGVSSNAFKDTSGLAKIGLGLKNTQGMADEINKLIPPRTSQAIDGLESATFDPTGTKSAVQFQMTKQKFEQQMQTGSLDIKNQIKVNILEMGKLGDSPEDEDIRLSLLRDNEALTKTYAMFQEIDNTGKGGLTANTLIGLYNSGLKNLRDKYQYSSKGGVAYLIDDDGIAKTGQDAVNRWTEVRTQFQVDYTANSLMNRDGTFKNTMTEDIPFHLQFGTSIAEQAIASFNAASKTTNGGGDGTGTGSGGGSDSNEIGSVSGGTQTDANYPPPSSSYETASGSATADWSDKSGGEAPNVFSIGTQGAMVSSMEEAHQYIANAPEDYLDGIVEQSGNSDFIFENMQEYREVFEEVAKNEIKDENIRKEFIDRVNKKIEELPKTLTGVMRSGTAMKVASMPTTYVPVKVEKLLSDEGGFMGEYLYTDADGVQYISPELPSKIQEKTKTKIIEVK